MSAEPYDWTTSCSNVPFRKNRPMASQRSSVSVRAARGGPAERRHQRVVVRVRDQRAIPSMSPRMSAALASADRRMSSATTSSMTEPPGASAEASSTSRSAPMQGAAPAGAKIERRVLTCGVAPLPVSNDAKPLARCFAEAGDRTSADTESSDMISSIC